MIVMMDKARAFDGRMYWRARDKEHTEYRRLCAGLSFPVYAPTISPGWIVILGEERLPRDDGRNHLVVLHARCGMDAVSRSPLTAAELMAEAAADILRWRCLTWLSPLDQPDCSLLPMFNRSQQRSAPRLSLRTPPRWCRDAFLVYDRLCEARTEREKSLHFGKSGALLADAYGRIQAVDRIRPLPEFPAVAALLYALAWLELTAWEGERRESEGYTTTRAGY